MKHASKVLWITHVVSGISTITYEPRWPCPRYSVCHYLLESVWDQSIYLDVKKYTKRCEINKTIKDIPLLVISRPTSDSCASRIPAGPPAEVSHELCVAMCLAFCLQCWPSAGPQTSDVGSPEEGAFILHIPAWSHRPLWASSGSKQPPVRPSGSRTQMSTWAAFLKCLLLLINKPIGVEKAE